MILMATLNLHKRKEIKSRTKNCKFRIKDSILCGRKSKNYQEKTKKRHVLLVVERGIEIHRPEDDVTIVGVLSTFICISPPSTVFVSSLLPCLISLHRFLIPLPIFPVFLPPSRFPFLSLSLSLSLSLFSFLLQAKFKALPLPGETPCRFISETRVK